MKNYQILIALVTAPFHAGAQGTLLFDQQSATNEFSPAYGEGAAMQQLTPPWGQSFTPSLSSAGFIRLLFDDGNINDGLGATIYLNLRAGSITGNIIGTTAPVTMDNYFAGPATFVFASAVTVTPGVRYYFEPILQFGRAWNLETEPHTYPGGSFIMGGLEYPGTDLWFREGIVVPEPSSAFLLLVAAGVLTFRRRKR
jgi:hypothetical protein